jgi:DNA-directed RNA polymerase subunit E'/Rpb7
MDKYFKTSTITKRCQLPISKLSNNIENVLTSLIKTEYEGKCSNEGFIQRNSVQLLQFSLGLINEDNITYDVTFEASICYPVEEQIINCTIENITKAGVKAIVSKNDNPIVIFAARDLHLDNDEFNKLAVNDNINISILGIRFELYDKYISAIGKFINKT